MRYKAMRLMCMFDLPMDSTAEQRAYTKFRKKLLEEGFVMLQYSVYMRSCASRDHANRIKKKIKKYVPEKGHIRAIMITEKQYEDMEIFIGEKNNSEKILGRSRLIEL